MSHNPIKDFTFIDSFPPCCSTLILIAFGSGNVVAIEPKGTISESIEIPIENLNKGFSKVYVRLKDEKDNWGNYTSQLTFINNERAPKAKIKDIEYFLSGSGRPNGGNGTSLTAKNTNGVFDSVAVDAKTV